LNQSKLKLNSVTTFHFSKYHKLTNGHWSLFLTKSLQVNGRGQAAKAELLQLNRTQFSSLGIFICKKVGN
jgi:hypothetical protein